MKLLMGIAMHVVDQVQGVEAEAQAAKGHETERNFYLWKCRKEQTSARDGLIMVGQQLYSYKFMMESHRWTHVLQMQLTWWNVKVLRYGMDLTSMPWLPAILDFASCQLVLSKLHRCEYLLRGGLDRFNFVIQEASGTVVILSAACCVESNDQQGCKADMVVLEAALDSKPHISDPNFHVKFSWDAMT
jgi:hypothetical protein